MELVPNLVIAGRFRLQRPLGKGGMGSVWVAQHLGLEIPCALKFIEGKIADDPEMRMRFEREAKAAAQLRSPNVVQIFDHGIHEGMPYIAMELLVGEDLRHRLERVTRLSPRELLPIVEQVSRALTKAHAGGIVHRDLKPENVFLVHDDDGEIAKVLDFGIAKKQSSFGSEASHTRTGTVMGSPYYMSPEQANGTKAVDSRSDLWSFAVIIYECLTGLRPFESEGLGELMVKIFTAPLPVPSKLATVPPGFDEWWLRAATREPDGRFQTARQLSEALALGLGTSARGSTSQGIPAQTGPNAAAPIVPNVGVSAGTTSIPLSATREPRAKAAGRAWAIPVALVVVLAGVGATAKVLLGRSAEPPPADLALAAGAATGTAPPPSALAALLPSPVLDVPSVPSDAPAHAQPSAGSAATLPQAPAARPGAAPSPTVAPRLGLGPSPPAPAPTPRSSTPPNAPGATAMHGAGAAKPTPSATVSEKIGF